MFAIRWNSLVGCAPASTGDTVLLASLLSRPSEHTFSSRKHSLPQLFLLLLDHQLEDLGRAIRIGADLFSCGRVEDSEPGVDVPLVAVDTEGDIDLDDLDSSDVTGRLPRII